MNKAKWSENYVFYKNKQYSCSCGWSGIGQEASQGEMFNDLFELDCPKCAKKIGLVVFPTLSEMQENFDKLEEVDRWGVRYAENVKKKLDKDKKRKKAGGKRLVLLAQDPSKLSDKQIQQIVAYAKAAAKESEKANIRPKLIRGELKEKR